MSDLLKKVLKSGTIEDVTVLEKSIYIHDKDETATVVPVINIAFSARPFGGFQSSIIQICGPSKHFKTLLAFLCLKAYMDKHPDSVGLFYDCEFGMGKKYISFLKLDASRIIHVPIVTIEQMRNDMMNRLDSVERGEKVFTLVDSIGNLASAGETKIAMEAKDTQDMQRAKVLKGVGRMLTPRVTIKDIPVCFVNHIYDDMKNPMYPKKIVGGGQGLYLSSNEIWIIGRQQEKDKEGIIGWNFTINVEKSRTLKEKSQFGFRVLYDGGIDRFSGLLPLAVAAGVIEKTKNGNKTNYVYDGDNYTEDDTYENDEFWEPILKDATFLQYLDETYSLVPQKYE